MDSERGKKSYKLDFLESLNVESKRNALILLGDAIRARQEARPEDAADDNLATDLISGLADRFAASIDPNFSVETESNDRNTIQKRYAFIAATRDFTTGDIDSLIDGNL